MNILISQNVVDRKLDNFFLMTHIQSMDIIIRYLRFLLYISLEMPVPSQGHYGFHSFPVVD
jgi:hypothetical protein